MNSSSLNPLSHVLHSLNQLWFGGTDNEALARPRYELWFGEPCSHFRSDLLAFAEAGERVLSGSCEISCDKPRDALSLMVLLDQLPRYLYPGQAEACKPGTMARRMGRQFLVHAFDLDLPPVARWFFYLPFSYSESRADQECALSLFAALPAKSPHYEDMLAQVKSRYDLILRFCRFPQHNAALGRSDTPEEAAFLALGQPL